MKRVEIFAIYASDTPFIQNMHACVLLILSTVYRFKHKQISSKIGEDKQLELTPSMQIAHSSDGSSVLFETCVLYKQRNEDWNDDNFQTHPRPLNFEEIPKEWTAF